MQVVSLKQGIEKVIQFRNGALYGFADPAIRGPLDAAFDLISMAFNGELDSTTFKALAGFLGIQI